MTYFAAIGIRQIQSYLARSRHLWGRRGASDMLAYLTATAGPDNAPDQRRFRTAAEVLEDHAGVDFDRDALDVDSIVNVRGEDHDAVARATKALALNIKLHLPAAHVETTIREGKTYRDVIRAENAREVAEHVEYPPTRIEFPLAHHCDECSSGMASRTKNTPDGELRLCPDCLSRATDNGRNRLLDKAQFVPQVGFLVEQDMLAQLDCKQVENFKQLAAMGDRDGKGRRVHTDNHVATIFVDGNGFGTLFRELRTEAAQSEQGLKELARVSKAVKDATRAALQSAIEHIHEQGNIMPAVPHLLGGDDLLVTVPATRAWAFLTRFLERLRDIVHNIDFGPVTKRPSFSAGMVICKLAYPIGDQVELAADLLRSAKEAVDGKDWSFAWLDVTDGGPVVPERVYTLVDWEALQELIDLARKVGRDDQAGSDGNNSALAAIRSELGLRDPELRTAHLRHLADRMPGAKNLFNHAFGSTWRERTVVGASVKDLQAVLNIMRWYA